MAIPLNHTLNKMYPGLEEQAALNTALYDLIEELKADFNLLLAKLDDDTGITDTDYEATLTISATSPSDPDQ